MADINVTGIDGVAGVTGTPGLQGPSGANGEDAHCNWSGGCSVDAASGENGDDGAPGGPGTSGTAGSDASPAVVYIATLSGSLVVQVRIEPNDFERLAIIDLVFLRPLPEGKADGAANQAKADDQDALHGVIFSLERAGRRCRHYGW